MELECCYRRHALAQAFDLHVLDWAYHPFFVCFSFVAHRLDFDQSRKLWMGQTKENNNIAL